MLITGPLFRTDDELTARVKPLACIAWPGMEALDVDDGLGEDPSFSHDSGGSHGLRSNTFTVRGPIVVMAAVCTGKSKRNLERPAPTHLQKVDSPSVVAP